ncbi:MAG: hypothetical protein DHS20C11_20300 [Lysobacteraceae bacterium]|nr:MAG: hypothetical protein DHS20C11_20300 [Xanthomonadaceae bacterium]
MRTALSTTQHHIGEIPIKPNATVRGSARLGSRLTDLKIATVVLAVATLLLPLPLLAQNSQDEYTEDDYYSEESYEEEYYEEEYYDDEEYYEEEYYDDEEYYEETYDEEGSYEEYYDEEDSYEEYYEETYEDEEYYEETYDDASYEEYYDQTSEDVSYQEYYEQSDEDTYEDDYYFDDEYEDDSAYDDDYYQEDQYDDGYDQVYQNDADQYDDYLDESDEYYDESDEYYADDYGYDETVEDSHDQDQAYQDEYYEESVEETYYYDEGYSGSDASYGEQVGATEEEVTGARPATESGVDQTTTPVHGSSSSASTNQTRPSQSRPEATATPQSKPPASTSSSTPAAAQKQSSRASSTTPPASQNTQSKPAGQPSMMESVLRDVASSLDAWQDIFVGVTKFDSVEFGKTCIRADYANCDRFVMTALVAYKLLKEGSPLTPLTQEQLASYKSYLARSAPRCVNQDHCLAREIAGETAGALITQLSRDRTLDFDGMYQKVETLYPNAPKVCVVMQVYQWHWFTYAAKKANDEGNGPAYLQRFNAWSKAKMEQVWPNFDPNQFNGSEGDIIRDGKRITLANKSEWLAQYCGASVWQ